MANANNDRLNDRFFKRYISRASSSLVCSGVTKRKFIQKARLDFKNYMEENPGATVDDIYTIFGTPEQMARNFMEVVSDEEINRARRNSKRKKIFILILGILIILALLLALKLRPVVTIETTIYSGQTLSEAYQSYLAESEQLRQMSQSQSN